MSVVFFSRCKPHGYDAASVARAANRIFFGHPLRLSDTYHPHALKSCIVDPSAPDAVWAAGLRQARERKRQYAQNRNLVQRIKPGAIALIPRPAEGVIYCGRVTGPFELVDDPSWAADWEDVWRKHKDSRLPDAMWLASEVCQTWPVDRFRAVPIPRVPAWIRRSLFGRSTYGVVPSTSELNPFEVMSSILGSDAFPKRTWTSDPKETGQRLMTDLTPSSFEHLCVSLLQLEHTDEVWTHVGGSGDGGLDGLGADEDGRAVALLQCKWAYHGGALSFPSFWNDANASPRLYLASLIHRPDVEAPSGVEFIGLDEIVQLTIKHSAALPEAIALRVRQNRPAST